MNKITYPIILFLFIFSFPIYGFLNSSHLSAIISIFLLINKKTFSYFRILLTNKISYIIILCYILMLLYTTLNVLLQNSDDFSMLKTIFNNFASFFVCISLVAIFFSIYKFDYCIEYQFSLILFIQSIIIILMLISPDIRDIIQNLIRTNDELIRMSTYNGVRGLGLAGSIAFGLAITMGLLFYVFLYWIICFSKIKSLTIFILFILCFIASMSAGRTAILGVLVSLIFLNKRLSTLSFYTNIIKYIIFTTISLLLINYWIQNDQNLIIIVDRYMAYVFQAYINYIDKGSFSVSSLSTLENMYFIPDNTMTILFGDAKYTNNDGSYYMHTDSGYMRFMLYFGAIGSLIPYISFLIFCFYIIKKTSINTPITTKIFTGIIIIAFISHYKAEVIFYNVSFMKIVYILGYYYLLKSLNEKKHYQNMGCHRE